MKTKLLLLLLLLLPIIALASCEYLEPVTITYTDPKLGITVTEKVGDGKFSPTIGVTEIHVDDQLSVHTQSDGSINITRDSVK